MNINCQPPLQFVYFSTDTHIPWISHNTLRDRLFKNGVAIRKKVYSSKYIQLYTSHCVHCIHHHHHFHFLDYFRMSYFHVEFSILE